MSLPNIAEFLPECLEHPYLFFSKEELSKVRDMCLHGSHAEIYKQKREYLDEQLEEPFPTPPPREQSYRNGVWEDYSRLTAAARSLVTDYAFAYVIEENPRYLEKTWKGLASIINWPSWVHPVHEFLLLDLDSSHTNMVFATVYDLLYDALTINQLKELEYMIYSRGLAHCIDGMDKFGWASNYKSNWCSVCVSNMGITALAMLELQHFRRDDIVRVAQESAERLWNFFDGIEDDGSWKEGPGYWNYGISTGLPFCDVLKRLTDGKVNMFDHPKLKITVDFPINCYLPPDRVVNFADCGKNISRGLVYRKLAQEYRHQAASYFDLMLTESKPSLNLPELFWDASDVEPHLPNPPHPSKYFPDSAWCIMRSSWHNPNANILALKIGATIEPHGHADVGNYIIHTRGKTVIRELGIGRYGDPGEWVFKNTHGHNLPLFNGKGQPQNQRLVGTVEETEFTEKYDYLRAELASAYGIDALTHFTRHYVFLRPDVFVVVDEIEVTKPMQMESRIHFAGECVLEGQTAEISNDDAQVNVRLLSPESATFRRDKHTNLKPSYGDPESLEVERLNIDAALESGKYTYAITFGCGVDTADVQLKYTDGKLVVQRGDVSVDIGVKRET